MFSEDRKPKRRLLITTFQKKKKKLDEVTKETKEIRYVRVELTVRLKILSHFIKGNFLTPMETILIIPRELEYLESIVKLSRRKKKKRQTMLRSLTFY